MSRSFRGSISASSGRTRLPTSQARKPTWKERDQHERESGLRRSRPADQILVAGSGTLVGTLLEADLVDELRLMVFPTVLGRGKRLFPEGIDRLKLKLRQAEQVGSDGVQIQIYERTEWGRPGA